LFIDIFQAYVHPAYAYQYAAAPMASYYQNPDGTFTAVPNAASMNPTAAASGYPAHMMMQGTTDPNGMMMHHQQPPNM
jgi:hypothetical protein